MIASLTLAEGHVRVWAEPGGGKSQVEEGSGGGMGRKHEWHDQMEGV